MLWSSRGTTSLFEAEGPGAAAPPLTAALRMKIASKVASGYGNVRPVDGEASVTTARERQVYTEELVDSLTGGKRRKKQHRKEDASEGDRREVSYDQKSGSLVEAKSGSEVLPQQRSMIRRRAPPKVVTPTWHAPWKLASVVAGHLGWVRCCAFDPKNEWFATGSADRTVKIWDLARCVAGAEGGLKLTLTGHINAIRGIGVSDRTTYMFTAGEDKKVMCWDLEANKVVRHYHGHLSGVYALKLHPTLDLLVTGGRDSCARVWDIRTSKQVMMLGGHTNTVGAIGTNSVDPQVITGSYDSTVRLWDLRKGKTLATLTNHKKAIRSLCVNPFEFSFVTAAADNLKRWQTKDGAFLNNFVGHNAVVNAVAVNQDEVLVSGGDDGSLRFWDYKTGYNFQKTMSRPQPGSLDCENGIYAATFDHSGSRLVTCEADKTIKIWKEDTDADPESHPIDMDTWTTFLRTLRRF